MSLNRSTNRFIWEVWHSLWVLWSFPMMACVGFFFIGKRVGHRSWLIWGGVYLVCLAMFFAFIEQYKNNPVFSTLSMIFWLGSIIHSFVARGTYINKLIAMEEGEVEYRKQRSNGNVGRAGASNTEQFASQYKARQDQKKENSEKAADAANVAFQEVPQGVSNETSPGVVDLNSCTVAEMTSLPGITIIMAKQAMEYRETHGGFKSFDEFANLLKLKPHIYVKLFGKVVCNPINAQAEKKSKRTPFEHHGGGRRLDL